MKDWAIAGLIAIAALAVAMWLRMHFDIPWWIR